MRAVTGSYTGNGVADTTITVGFQPDFVMVNGTCFRTSSHATNNSSLLANNSSNLTNEIKTFTSTGFTIGSSGNVNTNGTTYYYFACKDTGVGDFKVGTYTGDGNNNKAITGVGFSPSMVMIKGNSGQYGWWRTSNQVGDTTLGFAGFRNTSNLIKSIDSDGFTLGTHVGVNENGITFYYAAFGTSSTTFAVNSYTGNATDNRDITSVGFQPLMVWIKADNPISSVVRFDSNSGDAATIFGDTVNYGADVIQAFISNGFTIGTSAASNENNTPNQYFAIASGFTTLTKTFTAQAKVVNTTKQFTAKARVKKTTTQTFTARARVFRKDLKGALADLPQRSIDVMKWTKDTTQAQPTDATITNIVSVLRNNFNLTHIAVACPIDPDSFFPGGFTPSPRTLPNFYKAWTDAIHATGLRVLHRAISFAMEGDAGFTKRAGGNRYPQGTKSEVIPTNFSDNFNREQIYRSITLSSSTFTDSFDGTSISTTDYNTPVGNWSIVNNELTCSGVANATANVLWTKTNYDDFTMQAKVKKVSLSGFTGVVFRMKRDTNNGGRSFANYFSGYSLQLRGSGELRLENIATSNLASVSKTWVSGSYYQVKVTCTGTHIQAKVWLDGDAEPAGWDLDLTDTTYSSGGVGFCPENTSTTAIFDDISVIFSPVSTIDTDWNTVGNWSIEANKLKCTNAAAQYNNIIYTKNTYTDFTYTSKLTTSTGGITAVVFRINASNQYPGYSGYTARIKDNNTFQIEDLSLSTLTSVSKTFLPNSDYQVKIVCSGTHIQARTWLDGTTEPSTWDLDFTHSKYSTGSIGFAPENVTTTYFDDVLVVPTANYASWLGIVYQYIINNPTLFANGDVWAPFPERTEGIFNDNDAFISNSSPGVQQNYADFFNDLKDVSDAAFTSIGVPGVITGYTANNYSEVRSGWLSPSIFDKAGVTAYDYYLAYDGDNNFTGAKAKIDLDAAYTNRGSKPTVWQEWGPVPDMLSNITNNDAINHYGNVQYPNGANREVFIRDFYTTALAAALNQNKLRMFNYWGFWDSGNNDTGLATISGSTDVEANIKIRREGWILAEYFNAGSQPLKTFTARARVNLATQKTFTAKAKIRLVSTATQTFTAKAHISNTRSGFWQKGRGVRHPGQWTLKRD